MKFLYILLITACIYTNAAAQTPRQVSGVVVDTTGLAVIGATLKLTAGGDSIKLSTKADGSFVFSNVKLSTFTLSVTNLGYRGTLRKYAYNDGAEPLKLDTIILKEEAKALATVNLTAARTVVIKEDTIEYRASDYKLPPNSLTEDLLKKVPGLEVDKDGNVTAQGKSVTKVRVNGKDFFGGDLQTATKNLPADLIERIQIIDDYGDQANLTGSRTGDAEKIINITIRPDKNKGFYGNAVAGYGKDANSPIPAEDRYQFSGSANSFNNSRQISVIGNLNNTNTNAFNFNGGGGGNFGGGGGNRGGGSGNNGGGNFGFGGGGNNGGNRGGNNGNFNGGFGGGDGITSNGSIGFNYRDQWSKKLTSYGSYSYSNRTNDVLSNTYQRNYYTQGDIISNQTNDYTTQGINHRLNWNFEYLPDSLNYIKFTPAFSTSSTDYDGTNVLTQGGNVQVPNRSDQKTISNSNTKTPNIGANLLLNHRFHKPGRNVSLNLSVNHGETDGDQLTNFNAKYYNYLTGLPSLPDDLTNQNILTDNTSFGTTSRFLYIEPLGKRSTLEMNWNYSRTNYDNQRETFDLLKSGSRVDSLSNTYNYTFTSNNVGLSYRFAEAKYNYTLGVSGQPTSLNGESITKNQTSHRTGFNFVPVARFTYKFSRSKELNFNYFGRSNEPSYQQIQPVADRSNPSYPIIGNPELNAEFQHSFNLRFNNSNFQTGRTLFANVNYTFTNDKIVTNLVRNSLQQQETRYLNADGYYTAFGFYSYSVPLAERKYVITFRGTARYNNNVSFSNSEENISKNLVLSQRLRLQINPTVNFEISPSAEYINDDTRNTLVTSGTDSHIKTWNLGADGKMTFLKSVVFGFDYSKNINKGYAGTIGSNPQILSTYLEKQFFKDKRGTLRFQGFDLFNENKGFTNSPTANSLTQTRTNRLGRYFMLSLTMRIQKFAGGSIVPDGMQNPNQNRNRPGGGGGQRPPGSFGNQ